MWQQSKTEIKISEAGVFGLKKGAKSEDQLGGIGWIIFGKPHFTKHPIFMERRSKNHST